LECFPQTFALVQAAVQTQLLSSVSIAQLCKRRDTLVSVFEKFILRFTASACQGSYGNSEALWLSGLIFPITQASKAHPRISTSKPVTASRTGGLKRTLDLSSRELISISQ